MDDFDDYCIDMDTECLYQDIDDIDLYGTKLEEEPTDNFGDELQLD